MAENQSCIDSATIIINVREDLIYYIPNTFTPNEDELNNVFLPVFTSGLDIFSYQFLVFNRWGELIFESYDSSVGWDGTYQNLPAIDGVYTYKIGFKEVNSSKLYEIVGHLNLLK